MGKKMSIHYKCFFSTGDGKVYETEIPDIGTAKEGFWVDECFEYTILGSQCVYWIPPSGVRYVEKVWA